MKGACAQVSQLQQREKERERDFEKVRQAKDVSELERIAQVLVDQGLIRMERSESGSLDVQIIAATNTNGKTLNIFSYRLILIKTKFVHFF